jgi:hypothetical protein
VIVFDDDRIGTRLRCARLGNGSINPTGSLKIGGLYKVLGRRLGSSGLGDRRLGLDRLAAMAFGVPFDY